MVKEVFYGEVMSSYKPLSDTHVLYFRTEHVVIFILFKPTHAIFFNTFTFIFKTLKC